MLLFLWILAKIRCDCNLFSWYPDLMESLAPRLSLRSGNGIRSAQCADDTCLSAVSPLEDDGANFETNLTGLVRMIEQKLKQ